MKVGKWGMVVILFSLLSLVLISACGNAEKETQKEAKKDEGNIIFATMPVGGTINTVGNALASTITKCSYRNNLRITIG